MLTIRVFEPIEVYDYEVQINDFVHEFKDQVKSQSRIKRVRTRQGGRKVKGDAEDVDMEDAIEPEVATPPTAGEPTGNDIEGAVGEVEDTVVIRPEK